MTHAPARPEPRQEQRPEPGSAAKRRLFIRTYGCQMNVYDSERMTELLAPLGYESVDTPDGADLVILNTCHIREKAAEKVYSELGRIKTLKDARVEAGGRMTVAVAGCVAQAEGAEIMARAPSVDLVLGPQSYHKLPELISKAHRVSGERLAADFDPVEKFDRLGAARSANGPAAFVTVQEGCDKFCTFCVVPYTRGAEWSRPVDQIAEEARALVRDGVSEITLLGQNVNAFCGAGSDGEPRSLAQLVRHLAKIERLERIRFTTSHPRDMGDDLIAAFGEEPKLMPYLHLPVQSGSNKMLGAMNRRHSVAEYEDILAKVRAARSDIAISSDFIVGFPGESDDDFQDTLDLARRVDYAQAYSFKYSSRPGTPAAALPQQVPEDVKTERLAALQDVLETSQRAFNARQVGRVLPVLLDRAGKAAGQLHGRSPYLQAVHVTADAGLLGAIAEVEVTGATRNSLKGRLASVEARAPLAAPFGAGVA